MLHTPDGRPIIGKLKTKDGVHVWARGSLAAELPELKESFALEPIGLEPIDVELPGDLAPRPMTFEQ